MFAVRLDMARFMRLKGGVYGRSCIGGAENVQAGSTDGLDAGQRVIRYP